MACLATGENGLRLHTIIVSTLAWFALGCAANPAPQPQGPELFALPPPGLPAAHPLWATRYFWAGLALGWGLAWLWRRRQLARSLQYPCPLPQTDLRRLQAILRLLDELALSWRRKQKIKLLRRDPPPPRL